MKADYGNPMPRRDTPIHKQVERVCWLVLAACVAGAIQQVNDPSRAGGAMAFPQIEQTAQIERGPPEEAPGMTAKPAPRLDIRDYFAVHIAVGMIVFGDASGRGYAPDEIAGRSYAVADALLKAREDK